jgi:hypothetical protein
VAASGRERRLPIGTESGHCHWFLWGAAAHSTLLPVRAAKEHLLYRKPISLPVGRRRLLGTLNGSCRIANPT